MGDKYSHLTYIQRRNIESLLKERHSPREIAENINVSVMTVYREIKRGTYLKRMPDDWKDKKRYSADIAQDKYDEILRRKGKELKIGSDWDFLKFVEIMIAENKYSPQATLMEIRRKGLQFKTTICLSTLYNYIRNGVFLSLCMEALPQPRKKNKQNKDERKRVTVHTPRGTSIELRPAMIDLRDDFGHWEMDTVHGAQGKSKKVLLVLTERKTRKEIIIPINGNKTAEVVKALNKLERQFGERRFRSIFKSITVDNGSEFSDFEGMEKSRRNIKSRTKLYYCHAYSSYERGSNENQNKMIRRWIPKGTVFDDKTVAEIKEIEYWMNNYPRQIFDGYSAEDMYQAEILKLTG